ncbi:MAG: GHKL domain-containing protein [Oscillospiraceae bacterium]|nr:GHKL domain-containing protein [Oscillospiraceae bacterium]
MEALVLRYFAIIFCSLVVFAKSLNYKIRYKMLISQIIYSALTAFAVTGLYINFPEATTLLIFFLACVFNKFAFKNKWDITIITSVISCGIGYAFHTAANVIVSFIVGIFNFAFRIETNLIIFFVYSFILTALLVLILFKIKRFRKGFAFLIQKNISFIGVFISLIIPLYYTFIIFLINRYDTMDAFILMFLSGIILCAVLIIIWWRTGITKTYRDGLFTREIEELNIIIAQRDECIAKLSKSNEELAKIIHSDNKLIPALALAVREFAEFGSPKNKDEILSILEKIERERLKTVNKSEKEQEEVPVTKIPTLDIILKFMGQKAREHNIKFETIIRGNISYMTENLIQEENLRTVTADLLDNAIIAVKACKFSESSENKKILFSIGEIGGFYEISISDSGIDFEEETLRDFGRYLGKKRITTRKDEGGSGIGISTTFEILNETGASLLIEKYKENPAGFTKRVCVRFDGENGYRYS